MATTLTISLSAGQFSTTVGGSFGTAYAVFPSAVSTSIPWLTDLAVTSVLTSQFTVEFSVPVPPGGAQLKVDIEGLPGAAQGAITLADYLKQTRRLLRDETSTAGNLYNTTDLTEFINRAMQQRDLDLGMNRVRISFPLVVNQYQYQIADILAGGTILSGPTFGVQLLTITPTTGDAVITVTGLFSAGYTVSVSTSWLTATTVENQTSTSFQVEFNVPVPVGGTVTVRITGAASAVSPNVIDLLSIMIIPIGSPPSGVRVPLARWPYSRLAYLLSTSYPTYPQYYAMYGATGTLMVGPPPAGAYPAEWDFTAYSSPLVNPTDPDPLPYPWTDPIPFWAAAFAKLSVQRFDEAQQFEQQAMERTRRVMARGRPIAIQNPWFDLPRNAR